MHLTLLVPELIWPEPGDSFTLGKLAAPGLEWLLAHARLERHRRLPFETALGKLFGFDNAPFGALRLLGEDRQAARAGHWLCADPVHLRFHQERIILADASAFDIEISEAQALAAALNSEFADLGEFHVAHPQRWYLRLKVALEHRSQPLSAVAGRRVDGELGSSALPLTRRLNEIQMFMHGHPINQQREAAGKPAVNSLWLWGGGELDQNLRSPPGSALLSDHPLAAGLAETAAIRLLTPPANLDALLACGEKAPLLVLDQLLPAVLGENSEHWRSDFARMDNDWFIPLKNALGRRIDRINLIAPCVYGELHYTLTAGERWKFWKRPLPLQVTARNLAESPTP